MKVLTVLTILYSYHVCKCINSDDEDKARAEAEEIILRMTDDQLEEQMKHLRLGARPKTRAALTNQFQIDYKSVKETDPLKELEKVIDEEEEKISEKEKELRAREKRLQREEKRLQAEARRLEKEEARIHEQGIMRKIHEIHEGKPVQHLTYGYPKYDPTVKHFAPTFMYRPVDPTMLEKPPDSLNYKSYTSTEETEEEEDFKPEIPPPPPTSFPRPCQCSCRPKYLDQLQNDSNEQQQDQGAAGGQQQQQQQPIQPQQSTPSRGRRERDNSNFEPHKEFPPYGPGSMPQVPLGAAPVLPPPPPPPPFQNARPPVPSPDEPQAKKPAMYDDITPKKVSVSVEIKKGRTPIKSNVIERYGRNGRLCHIFIPLTNHDYKEVTYRGQTIWTATNDKRCNRIELCNIGDEDKIVFLDFNRGNSARYKKVKNKWYKI